MRDHHTLVSSVALGKSCPYVSVLFHDINCIFLHNHPFSFVIISLKDPQFPHQY